MLGLAYLLVFAVYLLITLVLVLCAAIWAKKHKRNPFLWGFGVVLVMYNLVFWDWIPSIVQHDYYCRHYAGFWIYKTLDQWKQENPGVFETLALFPYRDKPHIQVTCEGTGVNRIEIHHYQFNDRFEFTSQFAPVPFSGIHFGLRRGQLTLVDRKTGEVLAKYVWFYVDDGPGHTRIWKGRYCSSNQQNEHNFWNYKRLFNGRTP